MPETRGTPDAKTAIRKSALHMTAIAFAGLALASCQTTKIEEQATAKPLPAMSRPAPYAEGTVIHGISNGKTYRKTLIAVKGDRRTWQDSDGCTWTNDRGLPFGPSLSWKNCGTSGTTTVTKKSGDIWPLEVGKTVSYEGMGHTEGENIWTADRTCKVEGQARVTTHTGTYDTYKVGCRTKWRTMTWYMSPELGDAVKFVQRPRRSDSNSSRIDYELTRIEAK